MAMTEMNYGESGGNFFIKKYENVGSTYPSGEITETIKFTPKKVFIGRANYSNNTVSMVEYIDEETMPTYADFFSNGVFSNNITKGQLYTYSNGTLTIKTTATDKTVYVAVEG